ncbi:MAG: B12-binding domain-containing protein, partial [Erythrobacter sp.]
DNDECDFLDVTMGLWRLQEVMREVAARAPAGLAGPVLSFRALFSPMPGDHHNFGTLMIEEVFARDGWRSEVLVKPDRRELIDRLASEPFDLLGLTLARDCPSSALVNLIKAVRKASANPDIIVLVGGRMINEDPAIAMEVGADGTGADALAALELANSLVKSPAARGLNAR